MEVEDDCSYCGGKASARELCQGARSYCGQVCQSADRGQVVTQPLEDGGAKWKRYRIVRLLSDEGAFAQVWVVHDRRLKRDCALKIAQVRGRRHHRELLTACRLSGLDGFLSLYDYWVYTELPEALLFDKEFDDKGGPYYCMVMELAQGTLTEARKHNLFQTRSEQWQFYFEMVYSLAVAHELTGFNHGDIQGVNVVYRIDDAVRRYVIGNTGLSVKCNSPYRPLWIDFGRSGFRPGEPPDDWDICGLGMIIGSLDLTDDEDENDDDPTEREFSFDRLLLALRQRIVDEEMSPV